MGEDSDAEKRGSSSSVVESTGEEELSCMETWRVFPKTVFAIFGNELCERFSYYGMRTILTLYVVNVLRFEENDSIALFHGFIVLCYSSGVPGSIIADGYIGKFHTILWISIFYSVGNVVLAIAATFDKGHPVHPGLDLLGLIIIGLGTGGIKPCVSPFGGDQFKAGQERLLEMFFSVFYFSINVGALISTFITPLIRASSCMGRDSCYPAAFGLPAALMVVSVICFVAATPWYKRFPPKENVIAEVMRCIFGAVRNRSKNPQIKREHWIEHWLDDHSCEDDPKCAKKGKCYQAQYVQDIKAFLRQVVMCVPMPVFWALYDQQGSVWVIQAVEMNGELWQGVNLLPDQMTTLNAVLILIFIPIFQGGIYPLIRKFGVEPTPLRRMTVGGFLIAGAFIISMFVQLAVNETLPPVPDSGNVHVQFINSYPCNLSLTPTIPKGVSGLNASSFIIPAGSSGHRIKGISLGKGNSANLLFTPSCSGGGYSGPSPAPLNYTVTAGKPMQSAYVFSFAPGIGANAANASRLKKSQTGEGQFFMGLAYQTAKKLRNYAGTFFWCRYDDTYSPWTCQPNDENYFTAVAVAHGGFADYAELKPGTWRLFYPNAAYIEKKNLTKTWWDHDNKPPKLVQSTDKDYPIIYTGFSFTLLDQGGIYVTALNGNGSTATRLTIANRNTISILWQIPQYIVVTAAEILFSVTGLEFSYSQAPLSMKSVVGALWLLTNAAGDLLVLAIELSNAFTNLAWEQLCFAIIMAVVMVVFMLLSIFWYEYGHFLQHGEDEDFEMEEATDEDKKKALADSD